MKKIIEIARLTAMNTQGIKRFKLGAVLYDKKERIINAKGNLRKTHPKLIQWTQHPYLHAESHCLVAHGFDNCADLKLCVVRCDPYGNLRLARPCDSCQELIKYVALKECWYSTNQGTFEKLQ